MVENAFYAWAISYSMFNYEHSALKGNVFDYQNETIINTANHMPLLESIIPS